MDAQLEKFKAGIRTGGPIAPESRELTELQRRAQPSLDAAHDLSVEERWETAVAQLMPCEIGATELADVDDLALVNACLEVEHELRQGEFAAVEQLLGSLPSGDGALDYRLRKPPLTEFAWAASGL